MGFLDIVGEIITGLFDTAMDTGKANARRAGRSDEWNSQEASMRSQYDAVSNGTRSTINKVYDDYQTIKNGGKKDENKPF